MNNENLKPFTTENAKEYGIDITKGLKWHTPPYEIKMKLKYR